MSLNRLAHPNRMHIKSPPPCAGADRVGAIHQRLRAWLQRPVSSRASDITIAGPFAPIPPFSRMRGKGLMPLAIRLGPHALHRLHAPCIESLSLRAAEAHVRAVGARADQRPRLGARAGARGGSWLQGSRLLAGFESLFHWERGWGEGSRSQESHP